MSTLIYRSLKTRKPHQAESVPLLAERDIANFDDPGLGKAKQAYDTAGELFAADKIDLVVAAMSASLRENFLKEVREDASQLRAQVVGGKRSERMSVYRYPGCHMLILSYETITADLEALTALFRATRVLFVLDEAHRVKNPEAKSAQACMRLAELATKSLIFTGSPIPNKPKDLFTLFKILGHDVGDSADDFKERYPDEKSLRDFVMANSVRRKKDQLPDLGIPEKRIAKVSVDLSLAERVVYDTLNCELTLEVLDRLGGSRTIHVDHLLTKMLRLVQLSSNPKLVGAVLPETGSKLTKALSLAEELLGKGEKVVIWTSFRENVAALAQHLQHAGAVTMLGGMAREDLQATANAFQTDPSVKVLVATPACAREGFTLTAAANAIYLDRNFSLLDWQQSQDRIHRISQTRPCTIWVLEALDTLDERIDAILERKAAIQGYLLGDSDDPCASDKLDKAQAMSLLDIAPETVN